MTGEIRVTVAGIVAWISRFLTLQSGSVIATDGPFGVRASNDTFPQPGDIVEIQIAGPVSIRNVLRATV